MNNIKSCSGAGYRQSYGEKNSRKMLGIFRFRDRIPLVFKNSSYQEVKMRGNKLLAAFLVGVGLCFVPALGYGEVKDWWYYEEKATYMEYRLLNARVDYMMRNQDTFLAVGFEYDPDGSLRRDFFPERTGIDTKGKILVGVIDSRDVFSDKSGTALLDQFNWELTIIYSFLTFVSTEMSTDIVAKFYSREEIPLGYFYQGEYHLWEK